MSTLKTLYFTADKCHNGIQDPPQVVIKVIMMLVLMDYSGNGYLTLDAWAREKSEKSRAIYPMPMLLVYQTSPKSLNCLIFSLRPLTQSRFSELETTFSATLHTQSLQGDAQYNHRLVCEQASSCTGAFGVMICLAQGQPNQRPSIIILQP